jgi:hypothetical protein
MSTQPIPVFDPQGVLRDVPPEMLAQAVKAGGMPAVKFTAPDKSIRFVPANRTQEAYKAGGTLMRLEQQDVKHPGFWATLLDDVTSIPASLLHAVTDDDPMTDPNLTEAQKMRIADQQSAAAQAKNAQRTKEHGTLYSVGASANEMLGVNVSGEEKSAAEGDPGGVLGHAAAVPTALAASELGGRVFSATLSRAIDAAPETFTKKPSATPKLDATGENVPYAGEKPPKPTPEPDATGENKPFAGGMDEWTPTAKPTRPLSDLDPATAARKASARKPAAPPPAPKPAPVTPPAAIVPSGDPLLDRLRGIAHDIERKSGVKTAAEPTVPDPEEDLEGILRESLTPENLEKFRARKAALTVQ